MVYIRVPTLGILPELGGDWDDPSLERWRENFTGAPVHPDEDKWVVNYVGHPVNGAHMYVFARHNGFGYLASFAISTLGSVMWEYGVEGFFEPPSRSDLIVTSTLGSFLGEVYYQMFRKIRKSSRQRTSSAASIIASFSGVTVSPCGILLARQASAGFSQVPSPSARLSSRTSSFVNPFSSRGLRTCCSRAACRPGR